MVLIFKQDDDIDIEELEQDVQEIKRVEDEKRMLDSLESIAESLKKLEVSSDLELKFSLMTDDKAGAANNPDNEYLSRARLSMSLNSTLGS